MPTLSLNDIVRVVVSTSPTAAVRKGFNLGLIIGSSTVISKADRIKIYASLEEMTEAGFANDDPEYVAAQRYFSQNPKPTEIAIGRWDATSGESSLEALQDCRVKNDEWYACMICGAPKADVIATAGYIESATPSSVFFYTTKDADALAGTEGNVFESLKEFGYKRTLGQYSATDDAVSAIMGYAMGANTGLINSAYTLAYKSEIGVEPDSLTSNQVTIIENNNGNVYVNRGGSYNVFEQGIMADGTPFDEVINLDVLANDIQLSIMDILTGSPKVPHTEDGMALLIDVINSPCKNALDTGFVAPGIWKAAPILSLKTGDILPQGYMILSDTIANQSEADRSARKAPPIYIALKLAGAIEHVVVNVVVNR